MSTNLFVGSLPFSTTEDELKEHFAQAGTVTSVRIITDRDTGRSKGFGFVEMESDEDGEKAIEMFHDKELSGRTIVVNVARPREER